jgi:hypothetical protein
MSAVQFDRDSMARWYAGENLKTDPGIESIYYLPENAEEREIRFVIVNKLLMERTDDYLEPIDFGVDRGMTSEHKLVYLDVTPGQWDRIREGELELPDGWTLNQMQSLGPT